MRDDLARRRDIPGDDRLLEAPGLEERDAEALVDRGHGEGVACVERRALELDRGVLEVEDALVAVAREVVDERRIPALDADEHEAGLREVPPHELGRVEKLDVALVPLLAADEEHHRRILRNVVTPPELGAGRGRDRIRGASDAGRDDAGELESMLLVPAPL